MYLIFLTFIQGIRYSWLQLVHYMGVLHWVYMVLPRSLEQGQVILGNTPFGFGTACIWKMNNSIISTVLRVFVLSRFIVYFGSIRIFSIIISM
ncbi:hypothetical protein F4776DRAFT_620728 [Hypoxylon sp. NC0597]|nr:hypothetical protein F4776DRAFT_620728 [Hypoxylon sp. NC0597]